MISSWDVLIYGPRKNHHNHSVIINNNTKEYQTKLYSLATVTETRLRAQPNITIVSVRFVFNLLFILSADIRLPQCLKYRIHMPMIILLIIS